MGPQQAIETVAGVIQLAVAPVFLLAGIAGMLNVMSARLGRVVDRFRRIEARVLFENTQHTVADVREEADCLWRRIRLINWSIRMFVCGALLISMVIVALFIGELVELNLSIAAGVLFMLAMCLLIAGLVFFLFEIGISTTQIERGITEFLSDAKSTPLSE